MKIFSVNYPFRPEIYGGLEAALASREELELVHDPDDADLVVHACTPESFKAIPGAKNIALVLEDLSASITPDAWGPSGGMREASAIVTPSRQSADVIARHFPGPVHICPLGVDVREYHWVGRRVPASGKPFQFLSSNVDDDIGGVYWLLEIWDCWRDSGRPLNAVLYIRCPPEPEGVLDRSEAASRGIIYDHRPASEAILASLHHVSAAYIHTAHGAAFDAPLYKALATGLPAVWTHWGGATDLLNERHGFPIREFEFKPFANPGDLSKPLADGAYCDPLATMTAMQMIYDDYPAARARGSVASRFVHDELTWDRAAARLVDIFNSALE